MNEELQILRKTVIPPTDYSRWTLFLYFKIMGIDPAYSSWTFGIVVTEWADGIVQIMYAEEYHRPDYNGALSMVYGLMSKYDIDKVYIEVQIHLLSNH